MDADVEVSLSLAHGAATKRWRYQMP